MSQGAIVWKFPTALAWLPYLFPLGLIVLVAVQPPYHLLTWLVVLGLVAIVDINARMLRRTCTLDDRQLRAKGRFATRTVTLSDVRQVAQGLGAGNVWVHTHHPLDRRGGTYLYLRMIPVSKAMMSGGPTAEQAVGVIRARAEAAGAQLDPPVTPTRPRSGTPLVFSI